MRFDPQNDLFATYPQLERRKNIFDDEVFLKFLIYFLSPDSPFRDESDMELRAELSLEEIGLDKDSDIYRRYELNDEDVQDQIFALFQLYGDQLFQMWISYKISVDIMLRQLRDPYALKPTDRSRFMSQLEEFSDKILGIEEKLFPENQSVRDAIAGRVAELSLAGYAEKFALTLD